MARPTNLKRRLAGGRLSVPSEPSGVTTVQAAPLPTKSPDAGIGIAPNLGIADLTIPETPTVGNLFQATPQVDAGGFGVPGGGGSGGIGDLIQLAGQLPEFEFPDSDVDIGITLKPPGGCPPGTTLQDGFCVPDGDKKGPEPGEDGCPPGFVREPFSGTCVPAVFPVLPPLDGEEDGEDGFDFGDIFKIISKVPGILGQLGGETGIGGLISGAAPFALPAAAFGAGIAGLLGAFDRPEPKARKFETEELPGILKDLGFGEGKIIRRVDYPSEALGPGREGQQVAGTFAADPSYTRLAPLEPFFKQLGANLTSAPRGGRPGFKDADRTSRAALVAFFEQGATPSGLKRTLTKGGLPSAQVDLAAQILKSLPGPSQPSQFAASPGVNQANFLVGREIRQGESIAQARVNRRDEEIVRLRSAQAATPDPIRKARIQRTINDILGIEDDEEEFDNE